MSKILDNPKAFFDKLSTEEFDKLLDDFGFKYEAENIEDKYYNYSNLTSLKNSSFKKFTAFNYGCSNINNIDKLKRGFTVGEGLCNYKKLDNFNEDDKFNCNNIDYIVDECNNDFAKAA